ncbi:single-stranded DNA-binding protein [Abyssicoccus albus]|uniref:single-stranded DNA-binding protein n=1 Tax=Abyssicoccus albus TaxID=1817405 RepID=UPI00097E38A5|nr:single-stranded DNA-binding protein [Abyssicoccus albus]AQL56433.1 hypothetical protein BVH56_05615 [Abyssicoccus albus]
MNQINLIGNICNDLNLQIAPSGMEYLNFTVAIQRKFKNKQTGEYDTDFIRCKAFSNSAKIIDQYFSKGSKIGITGTMQSGQYEKDGQTHYSTDCLVENITFVEKANNNQQQSGQQSYQQASRGPAKNPFNNTQQQQQQKPAFNQNGPVDIGDDDLPF